MTTPLERLNRALAGRYRLDREIGHGAMAAVYLADDLKHVRPVAIKVLRPELSSGVGTDRFLREIDFASRLNHPRILPLHDSGQAEGALYYVMPYVEGETLRQRLEREKQLPVEDALRIAREVAEALDYANSKGIVHRDVKPDNIFLTPGGAVVADFGIARALEEAGGEKLTRSGIAIGTASYMPPEQIGDGGALDGRADQYSLACVLYEMLAGEPPFSGPTTQVVIARHAADPVPPLRSARRSVPEPVERVVEKALAKTPADRFSTGEHFVRALALAQKGETPPEVAPMGVEPGTGPAARAAARWFRSRRGAAFIGLVALIGLAVLGRAVLDRGPASEGPLASASSLDPRLVVILPFGVTSTDPALQNTGEQAVELLSLALGRGSELRVVDYPTVLGLLDDIGDTPGNLPRQLELAATLGAGRLIRGSLLGSPEQLTLTASVISVSDGGLESQERVEGSLAEFSALVTRLAVDLFTPTGGTLPTERLADIGNEALEEYLAGLQAERAGEAQEAYGHFNRAVALDSTFDEAVVRRVLAAERCCQETPEWFEAADAAHARLERLNEKDRAYVVYTIGPDYPATWATGKDLIQAAEAAVDAGVRDPELYESLGRRLTWTGAAHGYSDWAQRAANALDRAIELGGRRPKPNAIALRFQVEGYLEDSNPSQLRALGESLLVAADSSVTARFWVAARFGDTLELNRLASGVGGPEWDSTFGVAESTLSVAAYDGLDLRVPEAAVDTLARQALTDAERMATLHIGSTLAIVQGRASEAAAFLDTLFAASYRPDNVESPQLWPSRQIRQALIEPGYKEAAARSAEKIGRLADPRPWAYCDRELWRVHTGDTTSTRSSIDSLWAWYARFDWHGVCPALLEALFEEERLGDRYATDEAPALERLDSLTLLFPREALNVEAPLIIARLREKRGEMAAAFAAAGRLGHYLRFARVAPAYFRLHGRLAAEMGDTAAARLSYARYLRLREKHSESLRPQVDSVQNELARLVPR